MEYEQSKQSVQKRKQIAQKRRKRRRQRAIRFFVGFIVIVFAVAVILSLTVLFPITTVSASGSSLYSSQQIISASGINVGENVFMSGGINADSKITKQLPYIKTVAVKRSFSGEIKITVTDTSAQICYLSDAQYFLCDADNKILETVSEVPQNILEIRLSESIKGETGEYMDFASSDDRYLADKIFNAFKDNNIEVQLLDISDDLNIKALVDNRLVLLFGTRNELDGKMAHFVGMYKKMSKDVSGIVTLSAWSSNKQESYFKESDISEYFNLKDSVESSSDEVVSDTSSNTTSDVTSNQNLTSSDESSSSKTSTSSKNTSSSSSTSSKSVTSKSTSKTTSSAKNNTTSKQTY